MGDALTEKAQELKTLILQSKEYLKFKKAKEQLEREEDLYQKVNAFRRQNFLFQTGSIDHTALSDEYSDLICVPIVAEYLNAELILCHMLQEVYEFLVDDIELDTEFL